MSDPPSDSVGWKDPSVSPNEAAEVALDLDYKQEIQSRIKKEGTMCPLCLTGHRV